MPQVAGFLQDEAQCKSFTAFQRKRGMMKWRDISEVSHDSSHQGRPSSAASCWVAKEVADTDPAPNIQLVAAGAFVYKYKKRKAFEENEQLVTVPKHQRCLVCCTEHDKDGRELIHKQRLGFKTTSQCKECGAALCDVSRIIGDDRRCFDMFHEAASIVDFCQLADELARERQEDGDNRPVIRRMAHSNRAVPPSRGVVSGAQIVDNTRGGTTTLERSVSAVVSPPPPWRSVRLTNSNLTNNDSSRFVAARASAATTRIHSNDEIKKKSKGPPQNFMGK